MIRQIIVPSLVWKARLLDQIKVSVAEVQTLTVTTCMLHESSDSDAISPTVHTVSKKTQ